MGTVSKGKIVVCGDVCPVKSNTNLFSDGDVLALFGKEILSVFDESGGLIINLEVPLTDKENPIRKSGPNLIAPLEIVNALKEMSLLCVGLSNNHILDQGEEGLLNTIRVLDESRICHVGAGKNISDARRPFIFNFSGYKIGIYACAEHEFTIADYNHPGANPFDPLISLWDIHNLSKQCDRVLVLFHGMKEHYQYPSPETVRRCRAMVDAGASAVFCQHSHCIGCAEIYNDSPILYGQGDFCFTKGDCLMSRKTGLMTIYDPALNEMDFIPVQNDGRIVRLMSNDNADQLLYEFEKRSAQIRDFSFVENNWREFCLQIADSYARQILNSLEPKRLSLIYRLWWKLFPNKSRISKSAAAADLLNILQCEAHNEVLKTALREYLNEGNK